MGPADALALSSVGGGEDAVSDALAHLDALSGSAEGAVENAATEDSRAFLLGQRSALQYAFASALPARTALGSLQAGLQSLRQSAAETGEHVHALSVAQAILSQRLACAEHATQRIDELDRRVAHAAGAVQALATTAAVQTQAPPPVGPLQRLALALLWGGPQGQTFVLTRLARVVLLQRDSDKASPLAPLLLVCMAEAAYQAISRLRAGKSGGALCTALAPLHFGTRVCRSVVWASAILLAAQAAKAAAHEASDAVVRPRSRGDGAQELRTLPAVDATAAGAET